MNKEKEIKEFVFTENSMLQKAKRYDEDIKYLLNIIYSERHRHAKCEEDMIVYANPMNVSKVKSLELLDAIIKIIEEDYYDDFDWSGSLYKECYERYLLSDDSDKRLFGKILKLIAEHFNKPVAC